MKSPDNCRIIKGHAARFTSYHIRKVIIPMEKETTTIPENEIETDEEPQIIEEIVVEELSIDGVCGVY